LQTRFGRVRLTFTQSIGVEMHRAPKCSFIDDYAKHLCVRTTIDDALCCSRRFSTRGEAGAVDREEEDGVVPAAVAAEAGAEETPTPSHLVAPSVLPWQRARPRRGRQAREMEGKARAGEPRTRARNWLE